MEWEQDLLIIGRVALAMACGGVIGAEREWAHKPAGFRTHMLIAGASALLVSLADIMVLRGAAPGGAVSEMIRSDPIRVVEAIVTGLGFIGAGTIFRARDSERIEGLTTAASILLVGAIGIAVALEAYVLAIGMTFLSLMVVGAIGMVERRAAGLRK
ncbi:MgtC/SapB family protein [Ectothiorhodospiraceae bacterium WFHF3C12]|nr:MgtC/SapB family protein [Ectothiorhodospiraceae bacterium WFHF3C12]